MTRARFIVWTLLISATSAALALPAAAVSPAVLQTLTLDPSQSQIDLDLTLAQTSNRVGGEIDVQYDLGPGQSQTAGIPGIRGVLADPINVPVGDLFTLTAPANSIGVTVTAAPGSLANTATALPSIPEVSAYQFTQPGLTLGLTGTLTLDDGETQADIDLATVAPALDQSIEDAQLIFDLGINRPPSTTLVAPIDSVFALPLGSLTIPVVITGTLTGVIAPSIPCDYDGSGQVDQGDLNLVLNNWGGPRLGWGEDEDFETATVDQEELNCVLNHWGRTAAGPGLEAGSVPEPSAALALLLTAGAAQRRR
ncbi:MAG: hypothetical protein AAF328_06915 [Planctomycetota bacterium]